MSVVTTLPHGRPLTYDDLASMPDDGHRYELLDGMLIVSPAPRSLHQVIVLELAVVLRAAATSDVITLVAPLDVVLADDTVLQPDVLVARRSDLNERNLAGAPLLAVEVLSPSTRRMDLWTKRMRYEAAGTLAYWVVDPDQPSLTAWDLRGGRYDQVAHVVGHEAYDAVVPFPVRVAPAELLGGG
jgi:Uma2 family endonuclease